MDREEGRELGGGGGAGLLADRGELDDVRAVEEGVKLRAAERDAGATLPGWPASARAWCRPTSQSPTSPERTWRPRRDQSSFAAASASAFTPSWITARSGISAATFAATWSSASLAGRAGDPASGRDEFSEAVIRGARRRPGPGRGAARGAWPGRG
ncbi:MAG: hypothetical protein ACLPKE_28675 [Streptosporangiaceae bacterium]